MGTDVLVDVVMVVVAVLAPFSGFIGEAIVRRWQLSLRRRAAGLHLEGRVPVDSGMGTVPLPPPEEAPKPRRRRAKKPIQAQEDALHGPILAPTPVPGPGEPHGR